MDTEFLSNIYTSDVADFVVFRDHDVVDDHEDDDDDDDGHLIMFFPNIVISQVQGPISQALRVTCKPKTGM